MASRSLAAARARRAGEQAPPVSGNRPGMSIAAHGAFAGMPANVRTPGPAGGVQQNPYAQVIPPGSPMQQQPPMPPQPQQPRGRSAVGRQMQQQSAMHQSPQANMYGGYEMQGQMQSQPQLQSQTQAQPGRSLGKISIQDALGLTTLRLGRVEQWILDNEPRLDEMEQQLSGDTTQVKAKPNVVSAASTVALQEQPLLADDEAWNEVFDRLQAVEDKMAKLEQEANQNAVNVTRMSEKVLRNERMATETKDLLKSFMLKYDAFVEENTNKFLDVEATLAALEGKDCSNVVAAEVVEEDPLEEGLNGLSLADLTGAISLN